MVGAGTKLNHTTSKAKRKAVGNPICKGCGNKFRAFSTSALYCPSCRRDGGKVSDKRLLNFAIKELGISAAELKERFKQYNIGKDLH